MNPFTFLKNLAFWRVQTPIMEAVSTAGKSAAKATAIATAKQAWKLTTGAATLAGSGIKAAFSGKTATGGSMSGAWSNIKDFTRNTLLGGKPLFYEMDNPHFTSWRDLGSKNLLSAKHQSMYNQWVSGKIKAPPMPEKVVTFNESLRAKMYKGAMLYAGLSVASAAAFHQDPSIPVVDMSDKDTDYGATGDYVLSSYYNNR